MITFRSLRYGKDDAAKILEVLNRMIGMEQLKEAWTARKWIDAGRRERWFRSAAAVESLAAALKE